MTYIFSKGKRKKLANPLIVTLPRKTCSIHQMILVNKQLYDMHFFQGEKKKLANPLIVAIPVATYMRGRLELCFLPTLIFPFAL